MAIFRRGEWTHLFHANDADAEVYVVQLTGRHVKHERVAKHWVHVVTAGRRLVLLQLSPFEHHVYLHISLWGIYQEINTEFVW